jgi:hypothetical protein
MPVSKRGGKMTIVHRKGKNGIPKTFIRKGARPHVAKPSRKKK